MPRIGLHRRHFVFAALALGVGVAAAQTYPSKPVRLIVPYPVGTANETLARAIGQKLSERWGVVVNVESIAGAGGVLGTQALAKTAPDGYTLGWVSSPHAINAAVYASLPFDPVKDFRPIANVANTPLVLVANPALPARNVAELVALAKQKPGDLNYGSNGNGSSSHLATELMARSAGVRMTHVPYKSTGQLTTDLIAGQIDVAALGVATSLQMVKAGKLKALAVTGSQRAALLPDVPTVADTLPGYEAKAWMGLTAPAGLPDAIAAKVYQDVAAVVKDPSVQQMFQAQALDVELLDGKQLARRIEDDIRKWKQIVAAAGVKVE